MTNTSINKKVVAWMIEEVMRQFYNQLVVIIEVIIRLKSYKRKRGCESQPYSYIAQIPDQVKHLNRLTNVSDVDCILNLRMDRNTFGRKQLGSLDDGRYVSLEEQVAMFLSILAHHKKNRIVYFDFWRSGQTISHYVHIVLKTILKIHVLLLVKPQPVPEEWNYYLVDCGYANSEGFLAPYKGVCYHLKEWGPINARPQNAEELFNLRHAKARNVIERAFGILKMRWAALRSTTYYPIKVQVRLIMACVLLKNFIRSNMAIDPIEQQYDLLLQDLENTNDEQEYFVDTIGSSQWWNADRDALAQTMWQQYLHAMN
ncbi:uncharacterized protein LOC130994170 [Salvia miltiorrhiza]|uniref:uncharacterized protein LOC130994170 n=1 Tax=Salvia miltiorrhiza TaxID=226208 RepID=UPI0025AB83C7|nr:uncharacterized protein LOC130994170 [Salvia miltiorrhiza]